METLTTILSEFPSGGKVIVEQTLVSKDRNKSKRGLCKSHSWVRVGKLPIRVRSFEMNVEVSKDKCNRWVDLENLIYVR